MSKLLREFVNEVLDGFGTFSLGKDVPTPNLRYDVPTTGHSNSNLIDDYQSDNDKLVQNEHNKAAVCLVISKTGLILTVSRRDDPNAFGLPGGKVEPGELPAEAAIRELNEETGLTASNLKQIFKMRDAHGYVTYTFLCDAHGNIHTNEEGVIRWLNPHDLIDKSVSPFYEYNFSLFKAINLL